MSFHGNSPSPAPSHTHSALLSWVWAQGCSFLHVGVYQIRGFVTKMEGTYERHKITRRKIAAAWWGRTAALAPAAPPECGARTHAPLARAPSRRCCSLTSLALRWLRSSCWAFGAIHHPLLPWALAISFQADVVSFDLYLMDKCVGAASGFFVEKSAQCVTQRGLNPRSGLKGPSAATWQCQAPPLLYG